MLPASMSSSDGLPPKKQSAWTGTAHVVTGASSGIGRQIALAIAEAGASHVVVHYCQNQAGAAQTAAAIETVGARATVLQADLQIREDCERLVRDAWLAAPTIHGWVHNAGADVLTGAAAKLDFFEKLDRLWQVDVRGTIQLARLVAERMWNPHQQAQTQDGASRPFSMVFTGWDQATEGMEGDAGQMFGPVKAAVTAFAMNLAQSLAPHIRVNTVAPGWIQTAWGESTDPYWDKRARSQSLMNRWGTPADVAAAVLYALNPDHTFVTAAQLNVNGGWNRTYGRE